MLKTLADILVAPHVIEYLKQSNRKSNGYHCYNINRHNLLTEAIFNHKINKREYFLQIKLLRKNMGNLLPQTQSHIVGFENWGQGDKLIQNLDIHNKTKNPPIFKILNRRRGEGSYRPI